MLDVTAFSVIKPQEVTSHREHLRLSSAENVCLCLHRHGGLGRSGCCLVTPRPAHCVRGRETGGEGERGKEGEGERERGGRREGEGERGRGGRRERWGEGECDKE